MQWRIMAVPEWDLARVFTTQILLPESHLIGYHVRQSIGTSGIFIARHSIFNLIVIACRLSVVSSVDSYVLPFLGPASTIP